MSKLKDETGREYGDLLVIRKSQRVTTTRQAMWDCICSCWNVIAITGYNLRSGRSTRCKSCAAKAANSVHAFSIKPVKTRVRKLNTIIEIGDIAWIRLNRGWCVIDRADIELVNHITWHLGSDRYVCGKDGKTLQMHRVIMNPGKGQIVDHINGDRTDNRRSNLRLCGMSENLWNSRFRDNNSSGYKGVSKHKRSGRWQAKITVRYKQHHLGLFDSAEEAAKAYDEASKRLHGEYGKGNKDLGKI